MPNLHSCSVMASYRFFVIFNMLKLYKISAGSQRFFFWNRKAVQIHGQEWRWSGDKTGGFFMSCTVMSTVWDPVPDAHGFTWIRIDWTLLNHIRIHIGNDPDLGPETMKWAEINFFYTNNDSSF
jgi:hypothetical protein